MTAGDYCADPVRLNAAGWVVGALDPGDAEHFAGHMLVCQDCQRTVAELESAGRLLTMTSAAARAPAGLAASVLTRVRRAASQR
jgi:anti-sigma factor ChrR (cupin superfamily)